MAVLIVRYVRQFTWIGRRRFVGSRSYPPLFKCPYFDASPIESIYWPDSADTDKNSIPPSAQSDPGDIPPLQRVIIAVAVVIQAGSSSYCCPGRRISCCSWCGFSHSAGCPIHRILRTILLPLPSDKRQRQAAMVAVVQVDFSRGVYTGSIWFCICSTVRPHDAASGGFPHSPGQPGFHFPAGQHLHQHRREHHTATVFAAGLWSASARLRRCVLASSPVAVSLWWVVWSSPADKSSGCGSCLLYRGQPVAVPAVPGHLRFPDSDIQPVRSRSRRHTRFATLGPAGRKDSGFRPAALHIVSGVVHQPVLTVVMVPVGALIIVRITPSGMRSVFSVSLPWRSTGKDSARHGRYGYPATCWGSVRVQLRVGQAVTCRVCGIRISMPRLHIIIRAINLIYLFICAYLIQTIEYTLLTENKAIYYRHNILTINPYANNVWYSPINIRAIKNTMPVGKHITIIPKTWD